MVTKNGAKYTEKGDYAKGHSKNPMSYKELEKKFEDVLPEEKRKETMY